MKRTVMMLVGMSLMTSWVASASAQHKPRSSDEVAREYNKSAQTIQDEIDALRKKLDANLSMNDAATLIEQQSRLRKKADEVWAASQKEINESFSYKRQEFNQFNADNRKLEFQSAISGSQSDLLTNVGKYNEKLKFEQYKDDMSRAWEQNYGSRLKPFGEEFAKEKDELFTRLKDSYGIDLVKDGYSRIGTYNPYTGEVYYKYYDKDGKLNAAVWDNDAKGWEKANADFRKSRARQQELKASLEKEASQLSQDSAALTTTQRSISRNMTTLEQSVKRVNFTGSWSGRDNVGNTVRLTLNRDGSMTYYFGGRGSSYSSGGTWSQRGRQITGRTSDGQWSLRSRITEEFRLEFDEIRSDGREWRNYLNR